MMIVSTTGGAVELRDADNFRAFKIVDEARLGPKALGAALAGVATLSEDGAHAWVKRAAVAGLLPAAPSAEWRGSFDKMIEFARKHGWTDDAAGAVRAHVEYPKP